MTFDIKSNIKKEIPCPIKNHKPPPPNPKAKPKKYAGKRILSSQSGKDIPEPLIKSSNEKVAKSQ